MLRAHLFGGLVLTWDLNPPLTIPSSAARSLLAYLLAYRDRPHTRPLLAGTFWPDLPDTTARRRLSQALWQIGRALDPFSVVRTEGDTVQFNPDLPLWLDVEEFRRHHNRCASEGAEALELCERCVDLYRGEFLAGYYDDWAVLERERLRELFLETLGRLVAGYKGLGQYERALVYARRLTTEDPWREEAHREVMRLCHLLGREAEALQQFEICREALAAELGSAPSSGTAALAAEIAARSGLSGPVLLPSSARLLNAPFLERPDRLPLVGRRAELAELLRQAEAAVEGRGGLTVIHGEAGVGKSRLLRELADNAQWRGIATAWGRCYELAAPPAYQPLVEALRAGLLGETKSTLGSLWRAELSRLLPGLKVDEGPPPSLPPEEERRRLLEAIARGFLALATAGPHLILLEDTHWMDPPSLEALRYLLPRLVRSRLLVVITVRPEELEGGTAAALSAMEGTRLPRRLELGRLDLAETGELVERALGLEQPVPLFSARLHAETEGNPFYLIETLWALVEEGLLYRDEDGEWSTPWDASTDSYAELPLPAGVAQSIERRLNRLPELLKELVDLAAVIGRGVAFPLWLAASGREEEALLTAADDLCVRGLLLAPEPDTGPGTDYVFAHDQIRRVAYERLAAPRRRLYHRRVAEALTRLAPDEPETLAYHWTAAEAWGEAAAYHQQAGDRARGVYANAEAAAHYTQALRALERSPDRSGPEVRYPLLLGREAVHDLLGARDAQAIDLQALEALAEVLGDDGRRAQVALRQAHYAQVTSDYRTAIAAARRAIRWAQANGDLGGEASGYLQWGQALRQQGEFDRARWQLDGALKLARGAGRRRTEANCLLSLGETSFHQGDYAGAKPYFTRALSIYRELDDRRGAGDALWNLGRVLGRQSDYDGAHAHFEQARRILQQIGDRQGESRILRLLGVVFIEQGDYARAATFYEQALQISREIGDRRHEGLLLAALGGLFNRQCEYATARTYHEQALRICREIGDRHGEGVALASLGIDAYCLGDYDWARSYAEQARRISREIGDRRYEGWAVWIMGRILEHQGEDVRAGTCAKTALQISRQIGDRLLESAVLHDLSSLSSCTGDHETAHAYARQALLIARQCGDPAHVGYALTALGHALANLGRLDEAAKAYREAVEVRREIGQDNLAMESLAGLAGVSLRQGNLSQASAHAHEILEYLKIGTLEGTEEPFRVYLTCYTVLSAAQDPRAQDVIESAHSLLQERAATISDEATRRSFLENVTAHREVSAAYRSLRSRGPERRIAVSLPRNHAPLGRPLRDDEFVTVTWTVDAAEDIELRGKVARRRQRILRLLREARAQGATPRDRDLAEALGVSLSTLRRDMAALRTEGHDLPTRGRKVTT